MDERKPKRKYTKKQKRAPVEDDELKRKTPWTPEPYQAGRKDRSHCHKAYINRRKAAGKPTHESEWKRTKSGWKRSGPEEIEPDMKMTRYFRITKTIEEVEDPSIIKEHSELLPIPKLERSETVRL